MGVLSVLKTPLPVSEKLASGLKDYIIEEGYNVYQKNGFSRKWPSINHLFESPDKNDKYRGALTSLMLERVSTIIENSKNMFGESFVTTSLGQLAPRVLDVVSIFYPNLIQHYICDVQPVDGMVGTIFLMKPRYENVVGVPGVTPNSEVFVNMPTSANYASEEFVITIGTGNGTATTFTSTLPALPVRPGTVTVTAGTVTATDNGSGQLSGTGVTSGSVDYSTGALSITFANAPGNGDAVVVSYKANTEENPSNIRKLKFELLTKAVQMELHPLQYEYSVPASMAAQVHLSIDVKDKLSQLVADYIKIERDFKLVRKIYQSANTNSDLNFDASMSGRNYDVRSRFSEIELKVDLAESLIQNTVGRGGVDFVICGANAASVFRNCVTFVPAPVRAPVGAHLIGTLRDGTVNVIKVPNSSVIPANDFVIGFKGYTTGDSATVLAEWVPIYATPVFQSPNLLNSQGVFSAYTIVPNNTAYYYKGTITNYSAGG